MSDDEQVLHTSLRTVAGRLMSDRLGTPGMWPAIRTMHDEHEQVIVVGDAGAISIRYHADASMLELLVEAIPTSADKLQAIHQPDTIRVVYEHIGLGTHPTIYIYREYPYRAGGRPKEWIREDDSTATDPDAVAKLHAFLRADHWKLP